MSDEPVQTNVRILLSMNDPEPMYRQIEAQIRDSILSGQLAVGTKLPSVRTLAHDLGCSVITTRQAYKYLESAGFIRSRQGMGTMVAEISEDRRSAYQHELVEAAFTEAVRAGGRAGLAYTDLREILEEALHRENSYFNFRGNKE